MQCIALRLDETKLNRSLGYAYQKVLWLLVIGGSIALLVGAGLFLNALLFLAKAKSVPGTVIELVPNPNHYVYPGGYGCAPKVGFWEETRERRFEFISSESSYPPAYNEDERITVFYDPENPENAKIGDFRNLFVMPTVLFLYGTFFFVIGSLLIRTRRKIMRLKEM
jgi:hypothetical protein